MGKFKIKLSLILVFILSITLLTACSEPELSEGFEREEIEAKGEQVIDIVNRGDGEALLEMSDDRMREALDEATMDGMFSTIEEAGEFKEIEDVQIAGNEDTETEEDFGVAVIKAKYQEESYVYTITFTKDMKLAGLFYK